LVRICSTASVGPHLFDRICCSASVRPHLFDRICSTGRLDVGECRERANPDLEVGEKIRIEKRRRAGSNIDVDRTVGLIDARQPEGTRLLAEHRLEVAQMTSRLRQTDHQNRPAGTVGSQTLQQPRVIVRKEGGVQTSTMVGSPFCFGVASLWKTMHGDLFNVSEV
jgi:hypothetical protein